MSQFITIKDITFRNQGPAEIMKKYETALNEIITDSLWILDKRDHSGAHLAWYLGNFIPQIPHQMMLRYTKRGDWGLDTFVGSGTTLIECRRVLG